MITKGLNWESADIRINLGTESGVLGNLSWCVGRGNSAITSNHLLSAKEESNGDSLPKRRVTVIGFGDHDCVPMMQDNAIMLLTIREPLCMGVAVVVARTHFSLKKSYNAHT